MSVALETKNVYENFEVETDILFFQSRLTGHGQLPRQKLQY